MAMTLAAAAWTKRGHTIDTLAAVAWTTLALTQHVNNDVNNRGNGNVHGPTKKRISIIGDGGL